MNIGKSASVVELCQALVRVPSENPSGAPESDGEQSIAKLVGELLEQLGATVQYEPVALNRPNVYGFFPRPAQARETILFAPHLDTVPARGMTIDPFSAEVRDGRIFGRGASDTKGSAAAMLWALGSVDLQQLGIAVAFAGLADEEAGQLGAKACAARRFADFVIVGEPTDLNVVYTHKGTAWLRLTARGKSVHGSAPEQGENAIESLYESFVDLKNVFPKIKPVAPNKVLGKATMSLGRIEGGTKINVVPDRCFAELDIRTLPGQEDMAKAIAEFLARSKRPVVSEPIKLSDPLFVDPSLPAIARLTALGAQPVGAPWFCDAAVFAQAGTPAVALGPGSINQAHTADEHIAIRDLERGAEFFRQYLSSFRV
jgi:acetylornithine deacetylase/succinyl-diaminopimelate desuccinylase-like protein